MGYLEALLLHPVRRKNFSSHFGDTGVPLSADICNVSTAVDLFFFSGTYLIVSISFLDALASHAFKLSVTE